jgi:hypothetical protein
MNDPGNGIEDPALRRALRPLAAEEAPRHLLERARVLAVDLPRRSPARERTWGTEFLPPLLGLGLLLALLAGALAHLGSGQVRLPFIGPGILGGALLPVGVLALVELARGAPTLRGRSRGGNG